MKNLFEVYKYKTDFPEPIELLEEWERDSVIRRKRLTLPETPLSIGVMGQVKAGKSSFLNNLLFEGKSLLPEAATPKTANLTRIRYAEKPSFVARFYTHDEWASIEKQAQSDVLDDTTRAAKELVKSANESGINIKSMLDDGQVTLEKDTLDELMGELNAYVGGDGRLTALVAETELALPLEQLIGIEVVDTPGMNDPVVSRTRKTREYMSQCDVVFFLSRASQFFDCSDQALLTVQLPQKGIKSLILVAAQFDMALLDDGFNRSSLAASRDHVTTRLTRLAESAIEKLALQREKAEQPEAASLLRSVGKPIFSSTHAALIGDTSNPKALSPVVNHTREQLLEMAEDCWSSTLTEKDWVELGNLSTLRQAFEHARDNKEQLLAKQRDGLEQELDNSFKTIINELRELAETRLDTLLNEDLASLALREQKEQAQLNTISTALSSYLHDTTSKARIRCQQIIDEIQQSAVKASQITERTGSKSNRHSVKISDSKWYNPFSWGKHHHESYSTSSSYTYLAATDAIENLQYYVQTAKRQVLSAFDDLIAPATLSAGLRRELLRSIDTANPDFDPRALRAVVESSLSGLELPKIDFEEPDVGSLFAGYSGEVKSQSDMDQLREKLSSAVSQINTTLVARLKGTVEEAGESLDHIADHLHDKLTERLAEEIKQLRAAMADKEKYIAGIQQLLTEIGKL